MGEVKLILGKFAKSVAQVKQKAKNAERASSVPPVKPKTYEDVEREVEEVMGHDPIEARLRKKVKLPEGAFLKRERLDSEGRRSFRYQGVPTRRLAQCRTAGPAGLVACA